MKIDLMLTDDGQAGLISDTAFEKPVSGVIFEMLEGNISIEFSDMESMLLNIPVSPDYSSILSDADTIFIGVIEENIITEAIEVPLGLVH